VLDRIEEGTRARPSLPLWAREPVVLARFPGVLSAVAGAAIVLALIAGAGPLFISSASNAALGEALQAAPPNALRVVAYGPISDAFVRSPSTELERETSRLPGVSAPVLSVVGGAITLTAPGGRARVTPVAIPGFRGHLQGVRGGGVGVWLDEQTATSLDVVPGDGVSVAGGSGSVSAPLAGVYRSIGAAGTSFWDPVSEGVRSSGSSEPPMFAPLSSMIGFETTLQVSGRLEWDLPFDAARLSLSQARSVSGRLQLMRQSTQDPHSALGASFQTGRFGTAPPYAATPLPGLVAEASDVANAAKGPIDTVSTAGWLLALFGVAAAGTYGVRRRRIEASLLGARGAGPLMHGARASLEAVLPVAAGGAAGFVLAYWMVRTIGPSPFIDAAARSSAVRDVALTLLAALVLFGLAAGLTARTELEEPSSRARRILGRAPWEAVVLVLAVAALYEVRTRKGVAAGPVHVDRLLVLFPVLFVAGVSGVAVRLIGRALGRLRGIGAGLRPAAYLAVRRVSAAPRLALLLVAGASLAFGILAFSGTVSGSVTSSADEKALVRVGSDVSVPLSAPRSTGIPASTVVVDYAGQSVQTSTEVTMHAVDPATFARGAYWNGGFASSSLDDLLDELASPAGSRLPVVVAGRGLEDDDTIALSRIGVPIHVVSRASRLPGTPGAGSTVVLASRSALAEVTRSLAGPSGGGSPLSSGSAALWARGDPGAILDRLRMAGVPVGHAVTARSVERTPAFLAVSWTFDFLAAIGAITSVVAVLGVLLYLQARQRDREVSYALASRMGLSSSAHALSVFLEVLAMLLAALVMGAVLAIAAAVLVMGKLDVLPGAPPPPAFRVPIGLIGFAVGAVVLLAAIGALAVQRRAGRARVSEVLRVAG
jgi:putative ABC transport system permease protein